MGISKKIRFFLKDPVVIILIVLLFLGLALWNINYPGLNTDEATNGVVSGNILRDAGQIAQGQVQLLGCYWVLFGKVFPIMEAQYSGATIPYLLFPFLHSFGASVVSLRLCSVLILAAFLVFLYYFCKAWFGRRAAALASLITATNLFFVQYSRLGLYRCEIFVMAFFWIGLFFLIKYSQVRRYLFLVLSFLFFGLSFSVKITFLYYAVALAAAYFLVGRSPAVLGVFKLKEVALMIISFCAGSFLIIAYNITKPWIMFRQLFSVLTDPRATAANTIGEGAKNWEYFKNLGVRIGQFSELLKGDISERLAWGVSVSQDMETLSWLAAILLIVSLAGLLVAALFSSRLSQESRARLVFLYIIYAIVLFLSPFTMSDFNQGHLLVLLPMPQVALAVFLCYLWKAAAESIKSRARILIALALAFTILFNIFMNLYYNIQMYKTGCSGRWSTAVGQLAQYLEKNGIRSPVMFEYDLHANLIFITGNKVVPVIYDKFFPKAVPEAYNELISSGRQIFYLSIVPDDRQEASGFVSEPPVKCLQGCPEIALKDNNGFYKDLFIRAVRAAGKKKQLDKVFFNRCGCPVYWLYKIY